MKIKFTKVFLICAILVLSSASVQAATYGRAPSDLSTTAGAQAYTMGSGDNTFSVNLSKSVALQYNSDGSTYASAAWHSAGNREFATGNSTPTVWWDGCVADPCGVSNALRGSAAVTFDAGSGAWTSL